MVSVSSVNNNNYHVAMRSSSVQNPMVSENYYNIMEEPAKEKKQIGIVPIALGLLGAIGIGVGIYKHRQVAGLQDDLAKLTKDVKDKDGLLKTANEALETAKNKISEFEKAAQEAAEKVAETVKEGSEKVAETVKEGAEKVKKNCFFKKVGEKCKAFGTKIKEGWNKLFKKGTPKA